MKKRRNGKYQFTAALSEITSLLEEGQTGRYIHEQLTENNRITMSYPQFQRYLSRNISPDKQPHSVQRNHTMNKNNTPTKQPELSLQKDTSRQFKKKLHNPSMTEEQKKELF